MLFKIQDKDGQRVYVFCPSAHPTSYPEFNTLCSELYKINPTFPLGYYNITLSNSRQVGIYCDIESSHWEREKKERERERERERLYTIIFILPPITFYSLKVNYF